MTYELPADLVELYRRLARYREEKRRYDSDEAWDGIPEVSGRIAAHPFWAEPRGPEETARAGRELLRRARTTAEGARIQPCPSPAEDEDRRLVTDDASVRSTLAEALDRAGLWNDLDRKEREEERRYVEETGIGLRFSAGNHDRVFFADGEELSERGPDEILELLGEMAPRLAACGVALRPAAVSGSSDWECVIELGGRRCVVWTEEERRTSRGLWYEATVRPLIVVNELLEAAGSPDRVYTEGAGGNDGFVHVLPMEVRALLTDGTYGNYRPESLVLADRSVWDDPAG